MTEVLRVPKSVTISCSAAFARDVAGKLAEHDGLSLDLDGLEEADLSFIQILLSARETAAQCNKRLRLGRPAPEAVQHLLERGGFLDGAGADTQGFWSGEVASQ
ncbi:STAS domain-containing protein [Sphingomonas glaciei]|uniref:STAS domain-containing protein n=1 Tax=Sphingomonas glaciei TaxID=2938948 RepID=A0ABY5N162_9SPHN|nr:STAS domain-containing protein [Sphingomonas glaciei]UUR08326.1 STAS domain-containing protein [Sphingomonas glaciei]